MAFTYQVLACAHPPEMDARSRRALSSALPLLSAVPLGAACFSESFAGLTRFSLMVLAVQPESLVPISSAVQSNQIGPVVLLKLSRPVRVSLPPVSLSPRPKARPHRVNMFM